MRAHWIPDLEISENYVLGNDSLHHLVNVIRIESGEELLLLNGKGLGVMTRVESISKKELRLRSLDHHYSERKYVLDLALGIPKRDALELCLKEATELGFRRIYLIRSDYSQMKMPETERMEKLLVSALEQSNASYLPEICDSKWDTLPWEEYKNAVMLDSQTVSEGSYLEVGLNDPHLLIVGPEGGFSPGEIKFLHSLPQVKVVNLPTPILRTPTALAVGAGIMIESLLK